MLDVLDTHHGQPHSIRRDHVYDDCIKLYSENLEHILKEFPFRVSYVGEQAIDTGGVSRDMYSAFLDSAYINVFDGGNILVPAVHPGADMTNLPILGAILSHGFLSSSFLPIRLAFPVIASVLLGLSVEVPDVIIMDSFVDFVSSYEGTILKEALQLSHTTVSSFNKLLMKNGCASLTNTLLLTMMYATQVRYYVD